MNKPRNEFDIVYDIKNNFKYFSKEELLGFVKWSIVKIHEDLKDGDIDKVNSICSKKLERKLENDREKYRLTNDIDRITIQFIDIYDCIKKDGIAYIKVYVSIYFYDNTLNNEVNNTGNDKYFDDIWLVTLKEDRNPDKQKTNKCDNCGSILHFDYEKEIFECKYCGNTVYDIPKANWIIDDIEIK